MFIREDVRSAYGYTFRNIFKNHKINCSIFEDGLTEMLEAKHMVAETWGRPLASPWCNEKYSVNNVLKMRVGDVEWY